MARWNLDELLFTQPVQYWFPTDPGFNFKKIYPNLLNKFRPRRDDWKVIWKIKEGLTRRNWNGMEWKWKEKWRVRWRENTRGIRKGEGDGTLNGVPMGSRPRSARGSFITSHFPSLTSILLGYVESTTTLLFDYIRRRIPLRNYLFTSLLSTRWIYIYKIWERALKIRMRSKERFRARRSFAPRF